MILVNFQGELRKATTGNTPALAGCQEASCPPGSKGAAHKLLQRTCLTVSTQVWAFMNVDGIFLFQWKSEKVLCSSGNLIQG